MIDAEDTDQKRPRQIAVFVAAALAAVVVGLVAFALLLSPPENDIIAMSVFLGVTALISIAAGVAAARLGWMRRSPRLAWTLMAGYLLAGALTLLNVLVTARLMFLNRHDLLLATVLLVFAAIIAAALGYLLSDAATTAITRLNFAAKEVAAGDLDVVVPADGSDEIAALARSFNEMTRRLREAEGLRAEAEATRRDLLTAVGHDLRTPLASVRVIVEALSDGVVTDPITTARYLRTAQSDLAALSRLVDDLFLLTSLGGGGVELDRQQNSLSDLISDTLESFSPRADQQGIRLRGEPGQEADLALFDARYVGRALNNLVENALRFTPPGGEILLRSDRVDGGVRVLVQDTGSGISHDDLPHVFERFYRGDTSRARATGESGLGLAIVKSVAVAHGGHVHAESTPGRGTTISFVLPA